MLRKSPPANRKSARVERLGNALRENLKRRKVQQRMRAEAARENNGDDAPPSPDEKNRS